MAYSELDRTLIRHFLGFSAIFIQADPRTEFAITSSQSIADQGTRPDASTENYVKGLIYGTAAVTGTQTGVTPGPVSTTGVTFAMPAVRGLIQIEANIAQQDALFGASSADDKEVEVDPAREIKRLRSEGRRLCMGLASVLGLRGVRADVFSSVPVTGDETAYPFWSDRSPQW